MHQILRSPELSQTPMDARPHTVEELENSLVHVEESGDDREDRDGRVCSMIVDIRGVRDGGGKMDSR